MKLTNGESCARSLRSATALGLAWCALSLIDYSVAHATFLHHDAPDVQIKVVDHAGPIWVWDHFNRSGEGGLPSINIFEKYHGSDDSPSYWSDVEVQVTVRVEQDHHGNPFDWFNPFRGSHDWGWPPGWDWDWCWDDDQWNTDPSPPEDLQIGVDKFVKNHTGVTWNRFEVKLGTGVGDNFVPSDGQDNLYFTTDPMVKEVTSYYSDPPQQNEDSLVWLADGGSPGQENHDVAIFWFGVHIPQELFEPVPHFEGKWRATFTLRQHADVSINPDNTIPEPASMLLLLTGAIMSTAGRWRRRA
ncbi:MAG: PEP-CTERM sorting domain-containing protein [Planctomycetales bacterium]|nr:PEP-CTERM sorting domain-containing protein [Planctomycetales bacterium]